MILIFIKLILMMVVFVLLLNLIFIFLPANKSYFISLSLIFKCFIVKLIIAEIHNMMSFEMFEDNKCI
jgi:hypothetical protein